MSVFSGAIFTPERVGVLAGSGPGMTARQAEVLNQSFNRARQSLKIGFGLNYDTLTRHENPADKITTDFLISQKLDIGHIGALPLYSHDPKIKQDYYDQIFKSDLQSILRFGKSENFSGKDLQKFMQDAIFIRMGEISRLKDEGISLTSDNSSDRQLTGEEILLKVADEIAKYGLQNVENFYKKYPDFKKRLDRVNSTEGLFFLGIKIQKEMRTSPQDPFLLKIAQRAIEGKKTALKVGNEDKRKSERGDEDAKITEYHLLLDEALEYLRVNSDQSIKKNQVIVDAFKLLAKSRDKFANAPIIKKFLASCMSQTDIFWFRRTKRSIKYPELYGETKQSLRKYENMEPDNKLLSESGNWWFSRKQEGLENFANHPTEALVSAIETFLRIPSNMRHGDPNRELNIMLIINDQMTAKISVPNSATRQEIIDLIKKAQYDSVDMSDHERYLLKAQSYKSTNRSKGYDKFYHHRIPKKILGKKVPVLSDLFREKVEGDYIFRLTTNKSPKTQDINSPFAFFITDSHKNLIDLDFSGGSKSATISFKNSHNKYDGAKWHTHCLQFISEYKKAAGEYVDEKAMVDFPKIDDAKTTDITLRQVRTLHYPLLETVATTDEIDFEKIVIKKGKIELGRNISKAIVQALANGIHDFYTLRKGHENKETENTPYDNIQPALITTNPMIDEYNLFKKDPENFKFTQSSFKKIISWLEGIILAVKRSDEGKSYHAIIAAPTGHLEEIIYQGSKHFDGTPALLKESKMLASDLVDPSVKNAPDDMIFVTAQSDSNGSPVNLNVDLPNGGAIGYISSRTASGNQAFTTCRMSPRNIQRSLNEFLYNSTDGIFYGDHNFMKKISGAKTVFSRILSSWEKLTVGKISYAQYQHILTSEYINLLRGDICGKGNLEKVGITNKDQLQIKLNQMLVDTAQNTIQNSKIRREKESFYAFMNLVREKWIAEI